MEKVLSVMFSIYLNSVINQFKHEECDCISAFTEKRRVHSELLH